MGKLKLYLRSTSKPLQQIVKRLNEEECYLKPRSTVEEVHFAQPVCSGDLRDSKRFYKLAKFANFLLKCSVGDNFCKLKNGAIVQCLNFYEENTEKYMDCYRTAVIGDVYSHPCESNLLGIAKVKLVTDEPVKSFVSEVLTKIVAFPTGNNTVYSCFQFVSCSKWITAL